MTRRSVAPESVRAWGFLCESGRVLMRTCVDPSERNEFYGGTAKPVRVRIVREADYRRLLRAAATRAKGKP